MKRSYDQVNYLVFVLSSDINKSNKIGVTQKNN